MARHTAGVSSPVAASRILLGAQAYPRASRALGVVVFLVGTALALAGEGGDHHALLAISLAAAAAGRGIGLRRPLLLSHLIGALAVLLLAGAAGQEGNPALEQAGVVVAAVIAFWSPPSPRAGAPSDRRSVAAMVQASPGDPLAPFALRADKSYLFSPDGRAAVAYRVRFGAVVVSGDPVGAPESLESAAQMMLSLATDNGWRLGVLGASEAWSRRWQEAGLRAVPIGRDVVLEVETFSMTGRRFRNLRQAVQRTRNAGVTTAVYDESALPPVLREELRAIVRDSRRDERRGFSMIMDRLLETEQQARTIVAVAFDAEGRPVAFHRFALAGGGQDISQDLPWRAPGAPNGVDERLAHDTLMWARGQGAARLSLSFAAFPELYATDPTGLLAKVSYWATHRLDRYIRLESLYRYLRKFHALGDQRFVMLRLRDLVPIAAAMLTLEFAGFRGERVGRPGWWQRLRGRAPHR